MYAHEEKIRDITLACRLFSCLMVTLQHPPVRSVEYSGVENPPIGPRDMIWNSVYFRLFDVY
jgi:hypothetical protein